MNAGPFPAAWRFDRFTLDLARDALLGPDGGEISLRPKSMALLRLLVKHAGQAVDRDAIMAAVWPDVTVGDESITQCVRDARKALGDEAQTLVKTVPKRGYLLAAEAVPVEPTPAAPRAERRLAAILAADIVGYSRLIEQDETGTLAAIKELRASPIDPLLTEHKGRVVKLMGDGAIVEFASVVDAVACAVAIQKAVADRQAKSLPDRHIVFRIGINLGDVVVDGEDLLGDGVNVAARLEQLCEPGGVLVSGTAFDHLQGRLGLPLEFTGEQQVKNIARPVRAYRVRLDGSAVGRRAGWAPSRRAQRFALAAAAALLGVIFAGGIWHFWPTEPPPGKPAIAVLPFDNYGGDEATSRLADGITEDIVTDLARFRELDVIARNSTEVYKGRPVDVRQVGRDLGVGYVLEGSIQRDADRVRVTAQLIDARSGTHVWANRWDRPAGDLFAAQDELADQVASRLGDFSGSVAQSTRSSAKRKRPQDLSAYELYLLGVERKHRMDRADVEEAQRLFEQAIAKDPELARAHVGHAWTNLILLNYGAPYEFVATNSAAEAESRAAIALDPQDATGHAGLAEALFNQGRFAESVAEYERALELNPSSADIAAFAGNLAFLGQPERAAASADRALQLNPNYPAFYPYYLGPAYFLANRPSDAVRVIESLPSEQRNAFINTPLAGSYAVLGQERRAAKAADEIRNADPSFSVEKALATSWQFSRDQERQLFVEALRRAGLPVCADVSALADLPAGNRLPDCETERAKGAATGKAG